MNLATVRLYLSAKHVTAPEARHGLPRSDVVQGPHAREEAGVTNDVRDVPIAERCVSRRTMLATTGGAMLAAALPHRRGFAHGGAEAAPAFAHRGYYLTFMRMPT